MYYLVGGAGVPNYGDELMLRGWARWYEDSMGAASSGNLVLAGSDRKVLRSILGDEFPRAVLSDAIAKVRFELGRISFFDAIEKGLRFFDAVGRSDAGTRAIRELSNVKSFHLHGGGYLNVKWPSHGFTLGLGAALARQRGISAVATGIGLGPLGEMSAGQAAILEEAMTAYDVFEVRDQWSIDTINAIAPTANGRFGLDDSFVQPVTEEVVSGSVLHLSLIGDKESGPVVERLPQEFVYGFDRAFFWLCTPQDAVAFHALAKRFRFVEPITVRDLIAGVPVGRSNYMLTQRFHPHLMAARLGMSGLVKVRSDYYDVKHGSVFGLGSELQRQGSVGQLGESDVPREREGMQRDRDRVTDAKRVARKRAVLDMI